MMPCPAFTTDDVWRNDHQCDKPAGHLDNHWCFCGHEWPDT